MSLSNSSNDIIQTPNLMLRKFAYSDIDDMLKNWISDNDVQSKYGESVFTEKVDVEELLDKWALQYRWAIIYNSTNENIGHISFCRLYEEVNTGEVEYCLGKKHWGKGLITEALEKFISYTFRNTTITKIEAFHRIENPASGRVLQKVGMMVVDNILRFSDKEKAPNGDVCYAITKERFLAL